MTYPQTDPPFNLTLNVAGLTMQSVGDGTVQLTNNNTPRKFSVSDGNPTFTGTDWSFTPSQPGNTVSMNFGGGLYPTSFPPLLSQLPDLTNNPGSVPKFQVLLRPGLYTYPGGSLNVTDDFVFFSLPINSLIQVPEPSSFILAALGLIGLVVWKRRKRSCH